MRTIFAAYRISDLDRSLVFYAALGHREVGQVASDDGASLGVLGDGSGGDEQLQWDPVGILKVQG